MIVDQADDIGVTTLNAGTLVGIRADKDSGGLAATFTYSSAFTAVTTYFSSFENAYTSLAASGYAGKNRVRLYVDVGSMVVFTPTSLSIGVTAVPESSTHAVLAGFSLRFLDVASSPYHLRFCKLGGIK